MKNRILAVLLSAAVIAANIAPVPVFAASQTENVSTEETENVSTEETENVSTEETESVSTEEQESVSTEEQETSDLTEIVQGEETSDSRNDAAAAERTLVEEGNCGSTVTWQLFSDGTMILSGWGRVEDAELWYVDGIKHVIVSEGITSIGYNAFKNCVEIETVELPEGLYEIGDYAFYGCTNLQTINIPQTVGQTGDMSFACCTNLQAIDIPQRATIGMGAFGDCKSLEEVILPEGLTSIEHSTFSGCEKLKNVVIPKTVIRIDDYAFEWCKSLEKITLPETMKRISSNLFLCCSNLKEISIPETVAVIESGAFSGCKSLTSISIPEKVTSIGEYAFQGCESLTSISIPEKVTSIGDSAFSGCESLTSISIPERVTSIGASAFSGCKSLTSISIPEKVTSIGYSAFEGCESLTSISIPEKVTSIGSYAFSGCKSLTSISIPEKVTSIEDDSFYNCSHLKEVSFSENMKSIGTWVFADCRELEKLFIPKNVTSIGKSAFFRCSATIYTDKTEAEWNALPEEVLDYSFYGSIVYDHQHTFETEQVIATTASDGSITDRCFCSFQKKTNMPYAKEIAFSENEIPYDGTQKTPVVSVLDRTGAEIPAEYYTVTYEEGRTEIGTYAVTVELQGMYSGTLSGSFSIVPKELSEEAVVLAEELYVYDGTEKAPEVIVKDREKTLVRDMDYTVTYSEGRVNAGTYEAVVELKGNYKGTFTKTFTIVPKETVSVVTLSQTEYTYDGTEKTPTVTVTDAEGNVIDAESYDVTYEENRVGVGEYSVEITLKGNLSGNARTVFAIVPKELSEEAVVLAEELYVYDGTEKAPEVIVKDREKTLVKDTDYTVTYSEGRVNVGTYEAVVELKGNYKGTLTKTFRINPKETAAATLSKTEYTYDGKQKTPAVTVKDGEKTLVKGKDYTVTYEAGRTNVGTYKVTVQMKGNYFGTVEKTFTIAPKNLTAKAVTLQTTSYTYDGKQKTPTVTVKDGNKVLKQGTDYTVTYAAGRKNAGTYKVTVQMKGNYNGKLEKTFKINPKKLAATGVTLKTTSYIYDGKQKTPIVTVKNGSTILKKGTAYTVTYAAGRKNVGTYKVTVQMKGNYTGKIEKTFTINPKGTTISTAAAQKKGFKVTVKKQAVQTTGYQIQYATNNKFTGAVTKTIKNAATTSLTAANLKGGQKYFVRVRTYKTVNGKTYYSGWSAAKSVTTKK